MDWRQRWEKVWGESLLRPAKKTGKRNRHISPSADLKTLNIYVFLLVFSSLRLYTQKPHPKELFLPTHRRSQKMLVQVSDLRGDVPWKLNFIFPDPSSSTLRQVSPFSLEVFLKCWASCGILIGSIYSNPETVGAFCIACRRVPERLISVSASWGSDGGGWGLWDPTDQVT